MAEASSVPRTLVVTNDFPPRVGGVQQYVWNLVARMPPDRVSVLAPNWRGWREHDEGLAFAVERWPSSIMWPTRELGARIRSMARAHEADVVLFGHGYPLPVLGPRIAAAGLPYVVLTHGAEVWMARSPGLSTSLRRALSGAAAVTAVSRSTAAGVRGAVSSNVPLTVLYPGVDEAAFSPATAGDEVRARFGLADRKVVVCVSRLVPRKGQDVLIRAMVDVRRLVPGAVLLIVGEGPYRRRLEDLALEAPDGAVVFAGEVPPDQIASHHAAGDVFAMPCRSRRAGLEVEGFGIVFLEAAATGRPVVAGRSGGAQEAIEDERTGLLVEGGEPKAVALAIVKLLDEQETAERMGRAGRVRVEEEFTWDGQSVKLTDVLRAGADGMPS